MDRIIRWVLLNCLVLLIWPSLHSSYSELKTKLVNATEQGNLELAQGYIAILRAKQKESFRVRGYLFLTGGPLNITSNRGLPLLLIAIKNDNYNIATYLITAGANLEKCDPLGKTALMYAATHNNPRLVKQLIRKGAIVTTITDYNVSALTLATGANHAEIVQLLLEHGAPPNIHRPFSQYPIPHISPLHWATYQNNVRIAQMLIRYNADVGMYDPEFRTPLMFAAERGFEQIFALLLDAGADAKKKNARGRNTLSIACNKSQLGILRVILDQKIPFSQKQINKELRQARNTENDELIELLTQISAQCLRNSSKQKDTDKNHSDDVTVPLLADT